MTATNRTPPADLPATAATPAARRARRVRFAVLASVVGPGIVSGLSDDDPAGITTYSALGASHGYQLLWVLLVSTIALIQFHDLGARVGVVTGQGMAGLIRQCYGARAGAAGLVALIVANVGTTTAEFAGIAAGFQLFHVSRYVSVPLTAIAVSLLVLRGSFRRVEHVLLALSSVFIAYIAAGILAGPDWTAAAKGLVVPTMPGTRESIVLITATVGTTLAPWGLAFIQSYAVDKRLTTGDLPYLRIDVVTGSLLTGVIGFFVVVACAATLHERHIAIRDAADAAVALEPLAGRLAATFFALGLIGAALLAASILPLSTAYAVGDMTGRPAALNDSVRDAPLFYTTFGLVTAVSAGLILIPGAPLVTILVLTQVLNAVLLLPLLVFMVGIARDRDLMGEHASGRGALAGYLVAIAAIAGCVLALLVINLR